MRDIGKVAYLTGQYPAVSHTFIQREIAALREQGVDITTYSVRQPRSADVAGQAEAKEHDQTFYVLKEAKKLWPLLRAQIRGLRSPGRYFGALALAWRMRAPGWRAALYQLFYFAEATLIAQDMQAREISHIHNHFADVSANVAILAARLCDARFSYTLHGPAELYAPERWALKTKTKEAAFVACISHFARAQAMYFADPADWTKLKIIHCGVLPEKYTQAPSKEADIVNLVYVGRLTAIKGVRILLDAFADALKDMDNLHLTIVGDGDDRAHLEALAKPLGDRVSFTGYQTQSEVAETLAKADIFVLPSFAEGLPVVLMEALAAKVPVICTQVAGVPELVQSGVTGFAVPPGDVASLKDHVLTLARDPELREKMGRAGQELVCAEFDINKEAARLVTLFAGKLDGPVRPEPAVAKGIS